jgi:hypothetical protein
VGPKALTAIHGSFGHKYQPLERATTIADSLENQITPHDLCDENRNRRVEARVQAMLQAGDDTPLENVTSCDIMKLITLLKLERHLELMVFQTNASGTFQDAACVLDSVACTERLPLVGKVNANF